MNNNANSSRIVVAGGGISGITTAIEIAETGYEVLLIEKNPGLGGRVARMNKYFPKLCPPACGLEINFRRIRNNSRIYLLTSTEIIAIKGKEGNFRVRLRTGPDRINENCTACGLCAEVCPVETKDEFNYGMSVHKAVYLSHEMTYPYRYTIDASVCPGETCGRCEAVCPYGAVDLKARAMEREIHVAAVVFATGWEPFDPKAIPDYQFGKHPDVITNVMMERLIAPEGPTGGKVLCPSDRGKPGFIAFVQCTGSRDEQYLPYCSGVCCSSSLKEAMIFLEQNPEGKAVIYYIDLRVTGRGEDFLKKAVIHPNIELKKGRVGRILTNEKTGKPVIETENILSGKKIRKQADLVVLATGMVPAEIKLEGIQSGPKGFQTSSIEGIYIAGCAGKPMDVSSSLKDATGTALKAIQSLSTMKRS